MLTTKTRILKFIFYNRPIGDSISIQSQNYFCGLKHKVVLQVVYLLNINGVFSMYCRYLCKKKRVQTDSTKWSNHLLKTFSRARKSYYSMTKILESNFSQKPFQFFEGTYYDMKICEISHDALRSFPTVTTLPI